MTETKEKFLNWITTNYSKLTILANAMFGNDNGSDVINDLYLYFYEKPYIDNSIIENKKEFSYFYSALQNQYYTIRKNRFNSILNNLDDNADNKNKIYEDTIKNSDEIIQKYENVYNILNCLYDTKKITYYDFNIFILYFYTEDLLNIKSMDKKEVDSIRKISLSKLEKNTNITKSSLQYSLKKTLKIIKEINI